MTLEIDEVEKSKTRRALRIVNAQRKPTVLRPTVVTGKHLLVFMAKLIFWSAVIVGFVILWLAL